MVGPSRQKRAKYAGKRALANGNTPRQRDDIRRTVWRATQESAFNVCKAACRGEMEIQQPSKGQVYVGDFGGGGRLAQTPNRWEERLWKLKRGVVQQTAPTPAHRVLYDRKAP